jgi:hypothetical protein
VSNKSTSLALAQRWLLGLSEWNVIRFESELIPKDNWLVSVGWNACLGEQNNSNLHQPVIPSSLRVKKYRKLDGQQERKQIQNGYNSSGRLDAIREFA